MGFTDKMICDVAKEIFEKQLMVKYEPFRDGRKWYVSLDEFVIQESKYYFDNPNEKESQFNEEEEDEILKEVFDIFIKKLDIDEDDFEENEDKIDWTQFDGIISNYICNI